MAKDTSGSAFPVTALRSEGMTLRDYFAAKVLPDVHRAALQGEVNIENGIAANISKAAYQIADAMLVERARGNA